MLCLMITGIMILQPGVLAMAQQSSADMSYTNIQESSQLDRISEIKGGIVDSGKVTDTIRWQFHSGILELIGTGEMPDYASDSAKGTIVPWHLYVDDISEVKIDDRITHIGAYSFTGMWLPDTIKLPENLKSIGSHAFAGSSLAAVEWPEGLEKIGDSAFSNCNLEELILPDSVKELGDKAFYFNAFIVRVVIPEKIEKISKTAFEDCAIKVVQYMGTKEAWDKLNTVINFTKEDYYETPVIMQYNFVRKNINEHVWESELTTDNIGGCTEETRYSIHCAICGEILEGSTIVEPASGHTYLKWKTVSPATVFSAAKQKRECLFCEHVETRTTGEKLKPTLKFSVSKLKLKANQKSTALKANKFANGDSVKCWKSSNTKIVKVSGKSDGACVLTAGPKSGTAKITVQLKSGLKKSVPVTVQAVKTKKISGIKSALTLKVKKSTVLKPVLSPKNTTDKVVYKSSNTKIVTVNSKGKVTAKKKGNAIITVSSGSKKVTCKITVK